MVEKENQTNCLYEGPPVLKDALESLYYSITSESSEIVESLAERRELLETTRGHFGAVITHDEGDKAPKLSLMVDMEGRSFVGVSSSSPLEMASGLYRINAGGVSSRLEEFYEDLFPAAKSIKSTAVIIQEPMRMYFIAYCGNERLLRRERLKETLSGKGYFQMASGITDRLFSMYVKMFRKWVESGRGDIFVFPVQERIKLAFGLPPLSTRVEISVITELSRYFRSELLERRSSLRSSGTTPDMNLSRPATLVIERDLVGSEEMLERLGDIYDFYVEAVERSIQAMKEFFDSTGFEW